MSHHPTEMTLFLELDVEAYPPKFLDVNIGCNMHLSTKPGLGILVTVDAGNLGESSRALAGIIRGEPKYAWVQKYPNIDTFLRQWPT